MVQRFSPRRQHAAPRLPRAPRRPSRPHPQDLWRHGYSLHLPQLPAFISVDLARKVLRAGKSMKFLQVRCGEPCQRPLQAVDGAGSLPQEGQAGVCRTVQAVASLRRAACRLRAQALKR
jgi:hypothetical protein